MNQFLEFAQNHAALSSALVGLIAIFYMLEHKRSGKKISPASLGGFLKQTHARLIDIREPKDFREGHISGSENIPFSTFKDQLASLKNSDDPLVLVCKIGQTAGAAAQMLGKDNVYRLDGGILGWQGAGLPLVKSKDEQPVNTPYRKNKESKSESREDSKNGGAKDAPEVIEAEIVSPDEIRPRKTDKNDTIEIVAEKIAKEDR